MSAAKKPKHNESPLLVKEEEEQKSKHLFERLAQVEKEVVQKIFDQVIEEQWSSLILSKTFWPFLMLEVYKDKKPNLVVRVRRPPKKAIFGAGGLLSEFMENFTIVEIDIRGVELRKDWHLRFMDHRITTLRKCAIKDMCMDPLVFIDLIAGLHSTCAGTLRHLELNRCALIDKCFEGSLFEYVFLKLQKLETLSFPDNVITEFGLKNLTPYLPALPNLKLVDLRKNYISDEAKEILHKSLEKNENVEIHF
jgi:hypothetical protein